VTDEEIWMIYMQAAISAGLKNSSAGWADIFLEEHRERWAHVEDEAEYEE
jgi:hypothetical protein